MLYPHRKIKSFNVKITKALPSKRGRKVEFTPTGQLFIEMLDSTSNVEHTLEKIKDKWGPDYLLVTSDGLKLEDSPATRGIQCYLANHSYTACMHVCILHAHAAGCIAMLIKAHDSESRGQEEAQQRDH